MMNQNLVAGSLTDRKMPVNKEPGIFYPTTKIVINYTPEQLAKFNAQQAVADEFAKNLTVYEAIDKQSEGCILEVEKPD